MWADRAASDESRATSFDARYDGQVVVDVPQHGEVHVGLVRERHRRVERHQHAASDRYDPRLDGSVADPPLLRRRDADDAAGTGRAHVPVEALRVQPVVGEVVRRPVVLRLVPSRNVSK